MTKKSLFDALKSQKEEKVDLNAEKDEYLKALSLLYDDISTWLSPGIKDSLININITDISINEEMLGTPYTAPLMRIIFTTNKKVVQVEPVGTFMIGAWGRVDLLSGVRSSTLLRVKKQDGSGYTWCFKVPSLSGRGLATYLPLTEDVFLHEIEKLIF